MISPNTYSIVKPQGLLYGCGSLLVLSGMVHIGVWLILGGDWTGPVSWRKPILFGLSTGLTVLSTAWIYPKLQPRKWDSVLYGMFGIAMVAEVALITVQQWRGEASHFNRSSALDVSIENWMTYLIVFASVVLVEFTRRCFEKLDTSTDLKLAIRGGMTFLIVSCLIGFIILFYGSFRAAAGTDPATFGKSGVVKFPHGIAIHAIQFFPLICWLFLKVGVSERERTRLIGFLIASTAVFLLFSLVQTLSGRARTDVSFGGILLLALAWLLTLPIVRLFLELMWSKRNSWKQWWPASR